MDLLSRKADPRPIEERLQADFGKPVIEVKKSPKKSRRRRHKSSSARKTRSRRRSKNTNSNSMPTITKTPAYKRE